MMMEKKVLILYKFLPQWRKDFFNKLKESLADENIELNIIYGKLKNANAKKNDEVDLDWGQYKSNTIFKIGTIELLWQPAIRQIVNSDLIIVEQANKLLINYLLILLRRFTSIQVAFWGHGINLQAKQNSLGNRIKKVYSNQCDWWFAYTKTVKDIITSNGFSPDKVTVVNNAIDTKYLSAIFARLTKEELEDTKKKCKLGNGPVGLFCGGMYKEKRLDFLIDACIMVKKQMPSYEMIFIGAGPEEAIVRKASEKYEWIHYVSPKFNNEKVPFFKLADVFLLPDAVGLAILDSFAMQLPIITTKGNYHGPEIGYLENGINGIMTENTIESYCQNIIALLKDKNQMCALRKGCMNSAQIYTLENMVESFIDGIKQCLAI